MFNPNDYENVVKAKIDENHHVVVLTDKSVLTDEDIQAVNDILATFMAPEED